MKNLHLALYGNVRIPRCQCPECGGYALVIKGATACCGSRVEGDPSVAKRISSPQEARRKPRESLQRSILERQGGCCLYCERAFGTVVVYGKKLTTLRLNWDHLVPFAYAQSNDDSNFVAACHICNSRKGSRIFATLDDAKVYLSSFQTNHDEEG